jgi:hypothetical protein
VDTADADTAENAPAIPPFARSWDDPDEGEGRSGSTSFESDRAPDSLDEQLDPPRDLSSEMAESLPLPGKDEVFEADTAEIPTLRAKSALSREERIKLTKEAREKGLSPSDILAGRIDGAVDVGKEAGKTHGLVVQEMKTMIGMIRARKGVTDGADGSETGEESRHSEDEVLMK